MLGITVMIDIWFILIISKNIINAIVSNGIIFEDTDRCKPIPRIRYHHWESYKVLEFIY